MPTTSVANSSGAMMVLISRRKICDSSRSCTATPGQSVPTAAPSTIATRIQVVSERRPTA
jgi:hypothetical protein